MDTMLKWCESYLVDRFQQVFSDDKPAVDEGCHRIRCSTRFDVNIEACLIAPEPDEVALQIISEVGTFHKFRTMQRYVRNCSPQQSISSISQSLPSPFFWIIHWC
ncbi:hypothetical protein HELRODRAFT_175812 [Helobdella robusta]|uniref:Uncharacterized protein n=1 Tax=Helobdella robusta TaxID=6412 RepID=T1F9P8_HELRO|nr:hypothetical protein HELRODRAFT_175812 [Helobdella robusta]ESO00395.1 hypothetical protein HELRODRAFT_175812 [Helobdella robusta]